MELNPLLRHGLKRFAFLVADFYIILFDATRKDPSLGHGHDGYYFAETGEYTYHDVGKAIGEALVALGKADNPEPTPFTPEEVGKYLGVCSLCVFLLVVVC